MLDVQITRLDPELPVPSYAHEGDAGADLHAAEAVTIAPGERVLVRTGLSIAVPPGHAAFVHPRSGLALRRGLTVLNAPGTIDAGFRGEVSVLLINHDRHEPVDVRRGDRIAQLVVQRVEHVRFVETATLPSTARGDGGYGSTGGHAAVGEETR